MAINIVNDIIKHEDDEIIEYLLSEATEVYTTIRNSIKACKPELSIAALDTAENLYAVLKALDRRNKERGIK